MGRRLAALAALSLFAVNGGCRAHPSPAPREGPRQAAPGARPARAEAVQGLRGRLVCLLEELQGLHGLQVPPIHEHLRGFRAEVGDLHTILRTSTSGFLFTDPRFEGRTLVLSGRSFPPTGLLEVTRVDWLEGDEVREVYYWCEVCSIQGVDPGPCACCQGPVELRDRPRRGGPERILPPARVSDAEQVPKQGRASG